MKIAITGASGFIGRALVDAIEARGDTVITFVRSEAAQQNAVRWSPSNETVNREDLARVGTLDAVVHLAGAGIADKRWTASRKQEILESRVKGTSLIAATVAELATPPRVVLSGSAIGIYGTRGDEVLTEASSRGDGFLADVCDAWESAAHSIANSNTALTLLRTGIVMGASGGALKKQLPLFRAGLGGRLGPGKQFLSPISLRDHIRAMLFLIDQPINGAVNLVAPSPLSNHDFTVALGRAVHRPALAVVPKAALSIALGSELVTEALLASQRVTPNSLLAQGFEFLDPEIDQILASALNS
jgi:hypothetical protein